MESLSAVIVNNNSGSTVTLTASLLEQISFNLFVTVKVNSVVDVRGFVIVEIALASTTKSAGSHWKSKLSALMPSGIIALSVAIVL